MRLLVQLHAESIEARRAPHAAGGRGADPAGSLRGRAPLIGAVGAWVDFYGIVREVEDPSHQCGPPRPGVPAEHEHAVPFPVVALRYEAHEAMAIHQMTRILERLGEEHGLEAALVLHRVGEVPVGEASLLVRILASHRAEALRACATFIDELKQWVPIWKHPVRP
ncbi:MAG: molybdenum cofactor biosynthesis protein MoaE [Candidatus Eisenbacteria bacterium]